MTTQNDILQERAKLELNEYLNSSDRPEKILVNLYESGLVDEKTADKLVEEKFGQIDYEIVNKILRGEKYE